MLHSPPRHSEGETAFLDILCIPPASQRHMLTSVASIWLRHLSVGLQFWLLPANLLHSGDDRRKTETTVFIKSSWEALQLIESEQCVAWRSAWESDPEAP